jgi:hypothetical protein
LFQATPVPEQVLAATAAITSAQAALAQAHTLAAQRTNQDVIDRAALKQAERALADAQSAYEKVLDDPRTHTWAPSSPAARALAEAQDHYDVTLAQYNLHAADRKYAVAVAAVLIATLFIVHWDIVHFPPSMASSPPCSLQLCSLFIGTLFIFHLRWRRLRRAHCNRRVGRAGHAGRRTARHVSLVRRDPERERAI